MKKRLLTSLLTSSPALDLPSPRVALVLLCRQVARLLWCAGGRSVTGALVANEQGGRLW